MVFKLFKFSPQVGVSSVCLPKEVSQISWSLHLGFLIGCAKESIISPDAHTVPAAQNKVTQTHNQPQDLTGKWQCLLPSHTENSVGFHSESRNYLGAHKIAGLLPDREMKPEGNGRDDMEGKSLEMEQMPHVADREGLTPFSTLFWREWYNEKETENNYTETSKLLWGKPFAATIQEQKGNYKLAVSKHEGQCDLTCEAILIRTSSSTQSPVTALYLQNGEIRLRKTPKEPKSSHFQDLSFLVCNWLEIAAATPTQQLLVFPSHSGPPHFGQASRNTFSCFKRHWALLSMSRFQSRIGTSVTLQGFICFEVKPPLWWLGSTRRAERASPSSTHWTGCLTQPWACINLHRVCGGCEQHQLWEAVGPGTAQPCTERGASPCTTLG